MLVGAAALHRERTKIMQGVLLKEEWSGWAGWEERYLVLEPGVLKVFASEAAAAGGSVLDSVLLTETLTIRNTNRTRKRKFAFRIDDPAKPKLKYVLSGRTLAESQAWVRALVDAGVASSFTAAGVRSSRASWFGSSKSIAGLESIAVAPATAPAAAPAAARKVSSSRTAPTIREDDAAPLLAGPPSGPSKLYEWCNFLAFLAASSVVVVVFLALEGAFTVPGVPAVAPPTPSGGGSWFG